MARINYADINRESTKQLVSEIATDRGSVLHLYRMLLHSPPVAEGWLKFLTAIRKQCGLADDIRELVIMRVAALNNAPYESDQHRPIALAAGLTPAQVDALAKENPDPLFDVRQQAVITLTDAMTQAVQVPGKTMQLAREHFDERTLVELVATIAAYNMASRFLVAFDIQSVDEVVDMGHV